MEELTIVTTKKRFVPISAEVIETFLSERGFEKRVKGNEIVYARVNNYHPSVVVKVYTSIAYGQSTVRESGADAIRVVAAYEGKGAIPPRHGAPPSRSFGIYKAKKILRTGSEEAILERLLERMRETYAFTNQWLRNHWREVNEVNNQ